MANRTPTGEEHWDLVVTSGDKLLSLNLKEIIDYKFLILLFVRRDFVSQYKQTVLGPLWFVIQPIMTSGIYTVIFSELAKISTEGVPPFLFNLAGVTLWSYFSSCLTSTSNTLGGNVGLFGKVYFPRLTVPIATLITRLYMFAIQFLFFLIVYLVLLIHGSGLKPNFALFMVPVLVLHAGMFGMGIGLLTSALTIKYRDLNNLIGFGVGLAMYATPIFYPLSAVPSNLRWIVDANPMTPLVEMFRYGFTGVGSFNLSAYLVSCVITFGVLVIGTALFSRAERSFIDVV